MTPLERVEAAIVRLETLSDETRYFEMNGWLCEIVTTGSENNPVQEPAPLTSDPFIVVLHSTVYPILAILRTEYERISEPLVPGMYATADDMVLALADAILGAES